MSLFQSAVVSDWIAIYQKRNEYVARKEKKAIASLSKSKRKNKEQLMENMKLVEFDQLLFNNLRKTIQNRDCKQNDNDTQYITLDELSMIMKWKLFRGQFRPRLQTLIDSNKNKDVIECTANAFELIQPAIQNGNITDMDTLQASIKVLSKLKGVGVATASLILAIYTNVVPFMADESMLAIAPGSSLKYDKKTYINYAKQLIQKCNTLDNDRNNTEESEEKVKENENNMFKLTPFILGECLWTEYMTNKLGDVDAVTHQSSNAKKKKGIKRKKTETEMICSQPTKKRRLR
eukprot:594783_1